MSSETKSLYQRLGGYDAISAVANDLLPRLRGDPQLGRFWAHRGEDGIMREKQLLIDTFAGSVAHAFFGTGAPASRRSTTWVLDGGREWHDRSTVGSKGEERTRRAALRRRWALPAGDARHGWPSAELAIPLRHREVQDQSHREALQ